MKLTIFFTNVFYITQVLAATAQGNQLLAQKQAQKDVCSYIQLSIDQCEQSTGSLIFFY